MIDVRRVGKRFVSAKRGETAALADLSLSIDDGELVCLVGPSGCGKTTLLNLIAGLEKPDAGQLLVDGEPVRGPGPDRGVMFQDPALFPWLDVRENVAFGLRARGLSRRQRRERADRYLALVKLGEFAGALVHELSGGMRQRVALARALAMEPSILLMDEPFTALDARSRDTLQAELVGLWAQTRKTIVFVTHDVAEAVRLGSRVILLKARPARVARVVDVAALLPQPRHVDQPAVQALAGQLKRSLDEADEADDGADRVDSRAGEGSEAARAAVAGARDPGAGLELGR